MYNPGRIMLANLRALFGVIVDIVFLRRGPEGLPASYTLLVCAVVLQFVVAAVMWLLTPVSPENVEAQLLIGSAATLLCYGAALWLSNKRERFLQTMTATFATGALFAPLLIPLFAAMLPYMKDMDKAAQPPFATSLLGAALGGWLFIVQARIVRVAFEWSWFAAIIFIFAQEMVGAGIYLQFFGVPPAAV